ncbi:MAG: hypothetical protein IKW86_00960 [Salinivirgaceae bacterium]|nr:hypothetical protein [Salinivirgaceae bacterium]
MTKKLILTMTLLAAVATIFVACKKDDPTYSVQVTAAQGGTVEGQSGEYKEGETVVFKAIPADGYCFSQWSDGQTNNPRTITVFTSDISLTAIFIGVSATATEGGTVETQKDGQTFVFTATPADGYYFTQWSDGNTDNPRTIYISASDITLEAQFAQNALITITAGSNGTVSGPDNGRYAQGETLTFTAIPATGYCFSQWSDGNIDNPREITVGKDDISLTAEFVTATIATVDLGLPSGNLWATCNVGAANPWNYGDYYAWGETQTKDKYYWDTYKYCDGAYNSLTKYNYDAKYGTVDNKTTLESSDDVAIAVFGAAYSIPTLADWKELADECYWVWTADYNNRGVNGYVVYRAKADADKGAKVYEGDTPSASYSNSDAHIFLPAAGYRYNSSLSYAGDLGNYWSSSLIENSPYFARYCYFDSDLVSPSNGLNRCCGFSVRPVRRTN